MKVLKKGTGQKGYAKRCVCSGRGNGGGGCGAELLVEEGDFYETRSSDYTGDTDYYTTFCCPDCHVETDVEGVPYDKVRRSR